MHALTLRNESAHRSKNASNFEWSSSTWIPNAVSKIEFEGHSIINHHNIGWNSNAAQLKWSANVKEWRQCICMCEQKSKNILFDIIWLRIIEWRRPWNSEHSVSDGHRSREEVRFAVSLHVEWSKCIVVSSHTIRIVILTILIKIIIHNCWISASNKSRQSDDLPISVITIRWSTIFSRNSFRPLCEMIIKKYYFFCTDSRIILTQFTGEFGGKALSAKRLFS